MTCAFLGITGFLERHLKITIYKDHEAAEQVDTFTNALLKNIRPYLTTKMRRAINIQN